MHFIDKSYILCVLVSISCFFSLFFFLAQRIDCFSMNLFWGDDGGMIEGGAGEVSGGRSASWEQRHALKKNSA